MPVRPRNPVQPRPVQPVRTPTVTPRTPVVPANTFTGGGSSSSTPSIVGLSSPQMLSSGRVVFPWDKPGDALTFELTVKVPGGDDSKVKAELWTNANHNDSPEKYDALPMSKVRTQGELVTYRVKVPIEKVGNYRASARITESGNVHWASEAGLSDVRFRPHVEAHDALNMMELNVSNVNGGKGTLADLTGSGSPSTNGKYTLEFLKSEGINSVWVQPPFKRSVWDHRHPMDDLGSPYASKDYFAVDPLLSAKYQEVKARGGSDDEAAAAATQEWKDFVAKAHSLGIKVVVDVALNHVGHNYEFSDLFKRTDAAGKELREVRKNDFSQIAVNPEQLEVIKQRLSDPKLPDYMEYVAPWLYASRTGNTGGAQDASDVMAGGGQWFDTKQLNTGGVYGVKNAEENKAMVAYLSRVLEYWAVDMGSDGFRLDHLSGLPETLLEGALNHAQAEVDTHRPGTQLYFTGEDFAAPESSARGLDSIQDTWMRHALENPTPASIRELLGNPYFANRELMNLTSHDEDRWNFGGDMKNAQRMYSLMPLLGGANTFVAGDEFGENQALAFKSSRAVGALKDPSAAGLAIAEQLRRAGVAKSALAALQDDNRAFLDLKTGGVDGELLALARNADSGKKGNPVVVVANFNNSRARENAFALDEESRRRIDPTKRYQVRDLMADDPKAALWNQPLTGKELLDNGLFARLSPYQVQALELFSVP